LLVVNLDYYIVFNENYFRLYCLLINFNINGTVKAEIIAGLIPEANAGLFKAYYNMCQYKHCWLEKSIGATGNLVLHWLTEIGTKIEITAQGRIVAISRVPRGRRSRIVAPSAHTQHSLTSSCRVMCKRF